MGETSNTISGELYRAFWRWHFYAGLLVLPWLMLMALTGAVYLFKDDVQGVLYRSMMTVVPRGEVTAPERWIEAAEARTGARVVLLAPPVDARQAARLVIEYSAGNRRSVFVDPYDARVLGVVGGSVIGRFSGGALMGTIRRLHSLDFIPATNILVEVVAGWAIVLVATGVFLWWPRGRKGGVATVRATPRQRMFWRDLHAVTGVFAGLLVLFLAVTGMPWSAVWGHEFQKIVTQAHWGKPGAPIAGEAHGTHALAGSPPDAVPWATQQIPVPVGHSHGALSPGAMIAAVETANLPRPYVLSVPAEHDKVWSAAYIPDRVQDSRTLYLDGGSGRILRDVGYAKYGPVAKVTEWGVSVHTGVQYGWVSKWLMLAGCVAIWIMGISAATMWWKRRPKGQIAAPNRPRGGRAYAGLGALVAPLALLYPLVGASLIVALALDSAGRWLSTRYVR